MDFTFNSYALILIFFGTITLFLPYYVYKREGNAVQWFGFVMLSNSIWSLAYGFELASSSLAQIKFFINIEYIGITTLPLYWFLFCLKLSGKERWYQRRLNASILMLITIGTSILVWTNDFHHLYYTDYYMVRTGEFPMAVVVPGISYKLFTTYFYALLSIGNYLLFINFRKTDPIYKRQNYSIMIGAIIPWIANIAYLLGFRPLGNLDLTPFAFIATVLLVALAIHRFKLFDILPVAREKVLDLMQDGFMIIDRKSRIIDYNYAFRKYLNDSSSKKIIGTPIEDIFPGHPDFLNFITNQKSGKIELNLETSRGKFDLEVDIRHLNENKLNNYATIVKFQDLTRLRQDALKSQLQAEELQKLNQLKDRIFSIIAHDLRGPLVNLSEVLKMISNDLITIEEFKTLSPTLTRDILYTTDLLENILHWSRSQLSGYGINKEYFDLKSMVVNEVNYHLPSATSKKIKIIQDVFPGKLVYADMLMIQIVVRNLLSNAIKFCYEDCEIQITAVYNKIHMMELCIQDNGQGIPRDLIKKLFSGENISTRGTMNEKGTGLGLMVCKEFMEKNGGDIYVESAVGKGTKFHLYIPVEEDK